jgi:hypothetical protein
VFVRSKNSGFLYLEEKMKLFLCAVLLMFVVTGCAGVQSANTENSKGLTKEDYKKMGVDENKGYY